MRKTGSISLAALLLVVSIVRADTRSDFLALIDRPKVPLAPQIESRPAPDGMAMFHFTYAADAQQRVTGILLKSATSTGRRPVVISLHGTGGTKDGELPFLKMLVAKGFIGVAIDGRYHGERTKAGKGTVEYQDAILRVWRESTPTEHPFFYDTAWDVMRLIDYLQTRDDVDPTRIGLYGVSKGGIETYLSAAIDPRIAVAVPCIGVESFKWALENDSWHSRIGTIQNAFDAAAKESNIEKPDGAFVQKFYDRVSPKIYSEFDGPSMVPLIAPRPLMTINGDIDPRTPMPGLKLALDATQKAYDAAGAPDHFLIRIQPNTGHKVNPDSQAAGIEWFVKWLKP